MDGNEDLYGGGGPTLAEPQAPDAQKTDDKNSVEGQTFLLNKEIDPSFKVGEEMVVKIVAVHEKEYEVQYAPKEEADESGGEESMAEPASPGAGGGEEDGLYG